MRHCYLAVFKLDSGDLNVATIPGTYTVNASSTVFIGGLREVGTIKTTYPDSLTGIEETRRLTIKCLSNPDNGIDKDWLTIIATDELRNRLLYIYDWTSEDGATLAYRGKITGYSFGEGLTTFNTESNDDIALATLLPQTVNTTLFSDAPDIDIDKAVNLCFGYCRNVPLRLINNDTTSDYYDYLIGHGTIESIWSDTTKGVRRYGPNYPSGALVASSEYTFYDGSQSSPHAGYAFIRFTSEQRDFTGNFYELTADVKGLELGGTTASRNFASVIENILSDTTWGLSESVNAASFTTAATALDTLGIYCDGAVTSQRTAKSILSDLLAVSRGYLEVNESGEWAISVDTAYDSSTPTKKVGFNDNKYGGIVSVESFSPKNTREAVKSMTANYYPNHRDNKRYLQKEHGVRVGYGKEITIDLPFCIDNDTVTKHLSWIKYVDVYEDFTMIFNVDLSGSSIEKGDIILLNAPDFNLTEQKMRVFETTKAVGKYKIMARPYVSDIYTVDTITDPPDPDALSGEDNDTPPPPVGEENDVLHVLWPGGGSYSYNGNITGAIVVLLPQSWTKTTLKFTVDTYLYSGTDDRSFSISVEGYNDSASSQWLEGHASLIGAIGSDNRVRFGHNGSKCCVVIGESTSVWSYPKIKVRDFIAGHLNYSQEQWEDGWAIGIVNDLSSYTFTEDIPDALLDAQVADNTNYVNDSETESGYSYVVNGDLDMYSGGDINFYSDAGVTKIGFIEVNSGSVYIVGEDTLSIGTNNSGVLGVGFLCTDTAPAAINSKGNIEPLYNNTYNIGSNSYRYDKGYFYGLAVSEGSSIDMGSSSNYLTMHMWNGSTWDLKYVYFD